MSHLNPRSRILLALLATSVGLIVAIPAVPAQAETHYDVGEKGKEKEVEENQHLPALVTASESFKLTSASNKVSCQKVATSDSTLLGRGMSRGTWTFTKCEVLGSNVCTVAEPVVFKMLSQVQSAGTKFFVLFETLTAGQPIAEIEFIDKVAGSKLCTLGGVKLKLEGSTVAEVDNGNAALSHVLTFSEAVEGQFVGDELKFGGKTAKLKGKASLSLCSDEMWGVGS